MLMRLLFAVTYQEITHCGLRFRGSRVLKSGLYFSGIRYMNISGENNDFRAVRAVS